MEETKTVRVPYQPRTAFLPFHHRSQRFACMVCHRRAGKTVATVNEAVTRALYNRRKRPRYAYIAPLRSQAKKVAWEYVKESVQGIEAKKPSESELVATIQLPKGQKATLELFGADGPNAEAMRGNYFDGAIVDEYGDMAPSVLGKIIMPTLADRQGWLVLIGTFKGKNHFYRKYRESLGLDLGADIDPEEVRREWFNMLLKASLSGILPASELAIQRRELEEDEYLQEYECDPSAAVKGTYYAKTIGQLESSGQIFSDEAAYDPEQPVECVFDIGRTDGTAVWFWQKRPGGVALIDYFEMQGKGCDEAFEELDGIADGTSRRMKYTYRHIWLPHDAKAKTFATKKSTIEQFLARYGAQVVRLVPELSFLDGIAAARKVLPKCWFHRLTSDGVEGLRAYQREWDEENKVFSKNPLHNWASHPSDSFRYLSIVAEPLVVEDAPKEPPRIVVPTVGRTLDELFEEHERRARMMRRFGG
jgi:phage terminase large subunit